MAKRTSAAVANNDALDDYAETLKARCIREHGWEPELTKRVFAAYRQFLELKQRLEDWDANILSPSSLVDKMWHSHLLDNKHYREYCISTYGHEIFHDPEGRLDVEARMARIQATQLALKSRYDAQNIDKEVWDEMIHNRDVPEVEEDHQSKDRSCKKQKQVHCELQTLARNCAFHAREPTKIVTTKSEYNQRKCVCGLARTRTYCKCSLGVHRCPECYADHRIELFKANAASELNSVAAI
jgi:hypothetical protein